jgi:hypothetical protein
MEKKGSCTRGLVCNAVWSLLGLGYLTMLFSGEGVLLHQMSWDGENLPGI